MFKKLMVLGWLLGPLVLAIPLTAQDKPADNMEIVWEKIRADKKLFVADNMGLTEKEAKAFWPVYDDYQKELAKFNDRLLEVINDYHAHHKAMTNDIAKRLLKESVAIEEDRAKAMQSYLPRFSKALPSIKVARYYQVENKIRAIVNYQLAKGIPLMK